MAGTREDWAKFHGKAVRGRAPTHLNSNDFTHGVRVDDDQNSYGDDAKGSYPLAGGGWKHGERQQHAEAHHDNELARKRTAEAAEAEKAQDAKAATKPGGGDEGYTKEYFESLQHRGHHRTKEELAQIDAQAKELRRGQENYKSPLDVPKFTHKDLVEFNDKLPDTMLEFEDKFRQRANDPEAIAAKKEIVAALDKALKTYSRHIGGSIDTAREISPRSTEGRSALSEANSALSAAQSHIEAALDAVDSKDQLAVGIRIFRLGHIQLKAGLTSIDIALKDVDAVADRQIKHWTFVRQACEIALTVLGGAIEKGATTVLGKVVEGFTAKVVLAGVPAMGLAAEKISSQWNGLPPTITWAEVFKKGILDMGFAKIGNFLETKYFPKIDLFKAIKGLKDPNLRAWALKNTASITSSLTKELLQRAGSEGVNAYYGKPKEVLAEGVAEAAWNEYSRDSAGAFLAAVVNAFEGK